MTSPVEIRQKSHWEYVLEEMAWLANDFAQVDSINYPSLFYFRSSLLLLNIF